MLATIWDAISDDAYAQRFTTLGAISVRALELAAYDIARSTDASVASQLFIAAKDLEERLVKAQRKISRDHSDHI
ncbi:hypothetical protein AIOL_000085 [Candidatus Rhodobacter oscarellae]|uniref:Uncharacterized protein n=2 Tax=Candidatus Rhodobacter oscarellae TaxID=1675527 RepID=A0A0J9EBB5_9RHOB|nr:hypothetical protein AIOL_000085 [Candidatus Rhodobacter lobularis]